MTLNLATPFLVVVYLVRIERQRREPEERHRCLYEVADMLALWQRDLGRSRSRRYRRSDFGTKDPVPFPVAVSHLGLISYLPTWISHLRWSICERVLLLPLVH